MTNDSNCNWRYVGKYKEGLAVVMDQNDKWGFIDETGTVAILCTWREAWGFRECMAKVRDDNSLFGYIDKTGTLVIPCKWTNADHFKEGLARVMDESHIWYSIDKKGNVVKMLSDEWDNPLHPYIKDGKTGLIDKKGEEVIPCEWQRVQYSAGYNYVEVMGDNHKWGLVDMTGNLIVPCEWKEIGCFHEGLAAVQDEYGMWGFVDETGKNIIPSRWTKGNYSSYGLYEFHNGLSMVMDEDYHYGFINKKGVLVIPCNYRDAKPFSRGRAKVICQNGDEVIINKSDDVVEIIKSYEKERKREQIAKEKHDAKKEAMTKQKEAMLRDFYKQYGVKAQFILVKNYARTTSLFVVPAIKDQVVSFSAHKDFQREYYEHAMQLVEFLNVLTTTYGKSKVQKTSSLPQEANDALQAKLDELQLKDLWKGIFNESQRHYLDGEYEVVAAI